MEPRMSEVGALNVGILGHVDAGKTTLTRALAEMASTNAFDKHAEKEGRHNTLDLGFSSLFVSGRRLALVDCPGHASLIRAVLAASNVFDMAIVVIDASRGVEPQTAEHLLLASLFCPQHVVILLNKIDLIEQKNELESIMKRIRKALKSVGVNENAPIVPATLANDAQSAIEKLHNALEFILYPPTRRLDTAFVMAIDHCFSLKGKGTVLTGTVLEGSVKVGSEVEIPVLKEKRRVKEIQSWKETVSKVSAGERGALLVPNLPADSLQRALICDPGTLSSVQRVLATVTPVAFYKGNVPSGRKIHISTGFDIIMAECQFLQRFGDEYEYLSEMKPGCVVYLHFDKPVYTKSDSFYIASKLDHQGKGCRFAFHGNFLTGVSDEAELKKFSRKIRKGIVERIENDRSLICKDLFKKETKIEIFERMNVRLSTGEEGIVEHAFGKSGKARIAIPKGIRPETSELLSSGGAVEVVLHLKKYLHDRKIVSYVPDPSEMINV